MSRCYICDFSTEGGESVLHSGLNVKVSGQNRVVHDTILGKDICIACRTVWTYAEDDIRGLEVWDNVEPKDKET